MVSENLGGGETLPHSFKKVEFSRRGFNPAQVEECLANIRTNLARKIPSIKSEKKKRGNFIIVGGGPSLKDHVETIRGLPGRIVCMNDSHDFLLANGIKPWGCVYWEVAASNADFFANARNDVRYLVASQAHPSAFDKLAGKNVIVWHARNNIGEYDLVSEMDPGGLLLNGGCSAALRCFPMGILWGYRKFHVFGLDSSAEGSTHAYYDYEEHWKADPGEFAEIWCAGRKFRTNGYWMFQAENFGDMVRGFHKINANIDLTVYGDGLLPHIARQLGVHQENKLEHWLKSHR